MPSRPSRAEAAKRYERALKRLGASLTKVARAQAAARAQERSQDTRRKLLLGGVLLRLLRADRRLQASVQDAVQEHVAARPRDAMLFERSLGELASDDEKEGAFDPDESAQESLVAEKRDAHRKIILGGIALVLVRGDAQLRVRLDDALRSSFASSRRDAALFGLHEPVPFLQRG